MDLGSPEERKLFPHHPVNAAAFPNAAFLSSCAYLVECLPVLGLPSRLYLTEMEAGCMSPLIRKCQQIVVGGAYPLPSLRTAVSPADMAYQVLAQRLPHQCREDMGSEDM